MGALGGCYSTAAERDTVPSFRRYRGSRSAECRVPIATCGELLTWRGSRAIFGMRGITWPKKHARMGTSYTFSGFFLTYFRNETMAKHTEEKAQPEALATFAAAARNKGVKPVIQGATPETSGKPGNWLPSKKTRRTSNATGDKKRVDAARAHHAKTDKRAG